MIEIKAAMRFVVRSGFRARIVGDLLAISIPYSAQDGSRGMEIIYIDITPNGVSLEKLRNALGY